MTTAFWLVPLATPKSARGAVAGLCLALPLSLTGAAADGLGEGRKKSVD